MIIPRGHEHALRPASTQTLPDGRLIVHSVCVCTFEEQRVTKDGVVTGLKFRFGGLWFAPLDLLRLTSGVGVIECETCGGKEGLAACNVCFGLGVTDLDGMALAPRSLTVA